MLEMWELRARDDARFSTFSWRTRIALHHKRLDFVIRPVAVSDKAAIAFSGQAKVPIVKIDDRVVADSWKIAVFHHPLVNSGVPGLNAAVAPLWQALVDRGVEAALVGHDHA